MTLHWFILGLGVVRVRWSGAGRDRASHSDAASANPRREDALPGRWLLVTAAALQIAFVIAIVVIAQRVKAAAFSTDGWMSVKIALALPVIGTICVLGAVIFAFPPVAGSARGRMRRASASVRRRSSRCCSRGR